jgi:hypothetical protein
VKPIAKATCEAINEQLNNTPKIIFFIFLLT